MNQQNWGEQERLIRQYGATTYDLTPTIKKSFREFYLPYDQLLEQHDLTEVNYRRPLKVIREGLPKFYEDLDTLSMFHFSDDSEVNELLVKQFWEQFLMTHYNDPIGYETWDMFLLNLEVQLRKNLPIYNRLIREGFENFWDTYTGQTDTSNTSSNVGVGTISSDGTSQDSGETTGKSKTDANSSFTDTPEEMLSIDATNPLYATNLNGSTQNSDSSGTSKGDSKTHSETSSKNTSDGTGKSNALNKGSSVSRLKIAQAWIGSGFDQFMNLDTKISEDGELFAEVWTTELDAERGYMYRNGGRGNIFHPWNKWRW